MIFRDSTDIQNFLQDVTFFANTDCYCLGASRASAAEVIRENMETRETAKDVGMDITGTNETSK